ncbi:DUF6273 domain-containing protein [Emergencia sp. 1XD21-10]|uniref:DUF6273 domain-containing protein n=1 Tax=Emergencia sp. 1XD21-10 TaxID=2304569 RepID=UPI00137AB6BD|nr:DUF6273 domain-containing protein [Emergencia sp. 1XD21-10]NCE97590.1 toll/interleukin-1 receptor domain-containing protein [Emergencia sp. 1XD21-10]
MSIFKCKMCGGTLEITNNETVATCEYCGTKQTLPKLDDEKRANLYDRANHFRRSNEYDKAMGIYEQILNEDSTDAEAYWSLVLCRYGIEYVEDPVTHKRVPTVNRAQYASIYTDEDYKAALQHADGYQKVVYEEEAEAIDNIQKGILAISQREEPFDVFICYKETDNQGRRTPDSVLANDLYHQLTQEGFRVFFARITLEDKLGSAYEPYIFAALNSAKVMVVLGTKSEHFNAVWVKNEWSRYLSLIKRDAKKMLIPAYKDMDPYDLPEEFSHLQAQDMSKLGFMQDLIRGIKKITAAEETKQTAKETVVVSSTGGNAEALLKRAFMFLEDGDFTSANEYCEKVLDLDPENARGYLGKLMAQQKVRTKEALRDCSKSFEEENNYQKAIRFGDIALVTELQRYITYINERNELARKTAIYNNAKELMENAKIESEFKEAAEKFQMIAGFEDADVLAEKCLEDAEIARKDAVYDTAKKLMMRNTISSYERAIEELQSIIEWKDTAKLVDICQQEIATRKANQEARKANAKRKAKLIKKWTMIIVPAVIICGILGFVTEEVIIPNVQYSSAKNLLEEGKYQEAIKKFTKMGNYKESRNMITECKYREAVTMMQKGQLQEGVQRLAALGGYKDAKAQIEKCFSGEYGKNADNFKIGDSYFFGSYEQDNQTQNGKENIEWIVLDKKESGLLLISKYTLDAKPYYDEWKDITWKSSDLRSWLNEEFLKNSFSETQLSCIEETRLQNNKNSRYGTDGGKNTIDKIFLLSIDEAEKYFKTDEEWICRPTDYAIKQGVYNISDDACRWWLRSPGSSSDSAAIVNIDGVINYSGSYVSNNSRGVRPALWINLAS